MKLQEIDRTERITEVTKVIEGLLRGEVHEEFLSQTTPPSENSDIEILEAAVKELLTKYADGKEFIETLARGELNILPPQRNFFISPYKQLHAILQHLIWQVKEVAGGDYNQKVEFLGEFSESFNRLIQSLREKKELEEALTKSEEQYRQLFTELDAAFALREFIFDENGKPVDFRFLEVNHAFEILIDMPSKNLIGNSFRGIFPEKSVAGIKQLGNVALSGKQIHFRKYFENLDKHFNVIAFSPSKGKVATIFNDITDLVKNEEVIQKINNELAEANATKNKFFSIIAHDLKNPFHIIMSMSEILKDDYNSLSDTEKISFIEDIGSSSNKAYNLLEDLLSWASSQSGKIHFSPEIVPLKKAVQNDFHLLNSQASSKNIELIAEIAPAILIYADRNMFDTIIRNLLGNAIKFSYDGGQIHVRAVETGDFVTISVADNGIGLSGSDIQKLFRIEINNREIGKSKSKGTGLGLILCKEFVERHLGRIWVESEPNKGSTFFFTMPKKLHNS